MAGLTFQREKNRVVIDGYGLMIDEIKKIWDRDRTRLKDRAISIISYIHLASQLDPDAPFFGSKESEVKELAARNIWRNGEGQPRDLSVYDDDITAYQKAYETPDVRAVKVFNHKIDEIQELVESTKPKILEYETNAGSQGFSSNISIITKAMKELDELMSEKEKVEQRIKRQAMEAVSTLGSKKPSRMERRMMANG